MPKRPEDELPPDLDARQAWDSLPKGEPSPQATPPFGGGVPRWLIWLIAGAIVIALIGAAAEFLT